MTHQQQQQLTENDSVCELCLLHELIGPHIVGCFACIVGDGECVCDDCDGNWALPQIPTWFEGLTDAQKINFYTREFLERYNLLTTPINQNIPYQAITTYDPESEITTTTIIPPNYQLDPQIIAMMYED